MGDEALGVLTAYTYSGALDIPANREFVKRNKAKFGKGPSLFTEATYNAAYLINEATSALKGDLSNPEELIKAMKSAHLKNAPRGTMKFDGYGNPVQNVYIRKVERVGNELRNTVIHTYPEVSQFWKYEPKEYLQQPPYSRDYPPLKP
jgi:branched-chain amino acid transport system substrate-binding protein